MFMSMSYSGIIVDFGFQSFTFLPFYKGKGGIHLFKKLYASLCKQNKQFESQTFKVKMKLLNAILVGFLHFPNK